MSIWLRLFAGIVALALGAAAVVVAVQMVRSVVG
jgi:hypothetical protein